MRGDCREKFLMVILTVAVIIGTTFLKTYGAAQMQVDSKLQPKTRTGQVHHFFCCCTLLSIEKEKRLESWQLYTHWNSFAYFIPDLSATAVYRIFVGTVGRAKFIGHLSFWLSHREMHHLIFLYFCLHHIRLFSVFGILCLTHSIF